jgi:hypothetical protein
MVSSRRHIDLLEVPGRFAVHKGANETMNSGGKTLLEFFLARIGKRCAVVSDHFPPGGFIT